MCGFDPLFSWLGKGGRKGADGLDKWSWSKTVEERQKLKNRLNGDGTKGKGMGGGVGCALFIIFFLSTRISWKWSIASGYLTRPSMSNYKFMQRYSGYK